MRLRAFLCAALSLPLVWQIVFSGACIDVYAYSDGQFMTPADSLLTFGNSIPCKYYQNGSYVDATFTYNGLWSAPYGDHSNGSWTYQGTQFLEYTANISPDTNPQYITFDIQPAYSIFDTSQIHTVICLSTGSSNSISTVYQSPSWDWVYDGQSYHLENSSEGDISGQFAYIRSDGQGFTFVPADFTSSRLASGYSYRAIFSGNVANYPCRLLIGLPYVSTGSTGSQGTFTTSSGIGGDTNITVNVDMSETNEKIDETNGILSTIHSWLSSFFSTLGSTVLSWFMPSQNFLSNWVAEIMNTIEEHFSPWPILNERITTLIQNIMNTMGEGGAESVEFPAIDVPLDVPGQDPGASFRLSSQSVPLFPQGTSPIRDLLKDGLDMVCTIWVFNMVLNRIKAKILGEQVVEIEGVQEE